MPNDAQGQVVELDARRRASLGKVGLPEHTRYIAETREDGTIVLTPIARSLIDTPVAIVLLRKGSSGQYSERQDVACYTTELNEIINRERAEGWVVAEVEAMVPGNPPIEIYRDRALCPKQSDVADMTKRELLARRATKS